MTVTSLIDLRQQLAAYLAPRLPACEILYSMPTVRRPLADGMATLVLSDRQVKRSEKTLPGSTPLLLEVTLLLTALHRDSGEECEALTERLAALTMRGDFPCAAAAFDCGECGFDRGCGAFCQRSLLTVYCELEETGDGGGEEANG